MFTQTPFTGNPLAVFVDPGDLADDQLQRLAVELNLSESIFVWRPAAPGAPWPTRIFTPGAEIPFAGHPTVGAAVLLHALGEIGASLTLDERVGPVRVEVGDGEATLTAAETPVDAGSPPPAEELASLLAIERDALHPDLAPRVLSAGVPFVVVPVRDAAALARCRPPSGTQDLLYPVAPLGDGRWRVRMFAPSLGITEDPATGAAAAAFSRYLVDLLPPAATVGEWVLEQGVEMGRPSILRVEADRDGCVRVGGSAVVVGGGRLSVPPRAE